MIIVIVLGVKITLRCPEKFNDSDCQEVYSRGKDKLTMGSLKAWAREDSPLRADVLISMSTLSSSDNLSGALR